MLELPYSLVIEATEDPDFFGFYSDELEGFTEVTPNFWTGGLVKISRG